MATLLQALKDRYTPIGGGLPVMGDQAWVGVMPEGKAESMPMAVMVHEGESHFYDSDQDDVPYKTVGRVRFLLYATSLDQAEALSRVLWAGMEVGRLTVGTDARCRLERGEYRVTASPFRGPQGEFVYQAITPYAIEFGP